MCLTFWWKHWKVCLLFNLGVVFLFFFPFLKKKFSSENIALVSEKLMVRLKLDSFSFLQPLVKPWSTTERENRNWLDVVTVFQRGPSSHISDVSEQGRCHVCFLILSCRNNELGYSLDLTHGVCCHFEETRPEHKGHFCLQKAGAGGGRLAGHEFSRWADNGRSHSWWHKINQFCLLHK